MADINGNKIVGIDIDNTVTHMTQWIMAYGQNYSVEKTGQLAKIKDADGDDSNMMFNWTDEFDYSFWRDNVHQFLWYIKPRPLFVEMVNALRKDGYKIYIITARKEKYFGKPVEFTKKWLKKNKVKYDNLFVSVIDKGQLCKDLGVDYFIDDAPKYYNQAIANGINTYVMNSYVNKEDNNPDLQRVNSFTEFYYHITGKNLTTSKENKKYFKNVPRNQNTIVADGDEKNKDSSFNN